MLVLKFHFWFDTKSVGVIVLKATPLLLPVALCLNTSVSNLDWSTPKISGQSNFNTKRTLQMFLVSLCQDGLEMEEWAHTGVCACLEADSLSTTCLDLTTAQSNPLSAYFLPPLQLFTPISKQNKTFCICSRWALEVKYYNLGSQKRVCLMWECVRPRTGLLVWCTHRCTNKQWPVCPNISSFVCCQYPIQ